MKACTVVLYKFLGNLREFGIPKKLKQKWRCRIQAEKWKSKDNWLKHLTQKEAWYEFSIAVGNVIKNIKTNANGTIFNRTRQWTALIRRLYAVIGESDWISSNRDCRSCSKHWTGDKCKQNEICENKQKCNKFRARSDNEQKSIGVVSNVYCAH